MFNKLFEKLRWWSYPLIAVIGLLIIIDVPAYFKISLYTEQYLGIYLTMILFGTFISHPYKKGADFSVIDLILALLAIPAGLSSPSSIPISR